MKIEIIKPWEHEGKAWPVGMKATVQRYYGLQLIKDGYATSLEETTSYEVKNTTELQTKNTRGGNKKKGQG